MKTLGVALLLLLIAVSAIGPLALNGVLPATTAIIDELNTPYAMVQLVLTVFLVANLVSQVFMGIAADLYGRRPVMLLALVIFVFGSVICAIAQNIETLLFGRFVQGVGGAVCVFLPRTIVRDVYPQDRSASVIGYMTTAMMVAPLFGPAVGGWFTDTYSWRYMYGSLGGLGAVLLLTAYFVQPETLARLQNAQDFKSKVNSNSFLNSARLLLKDEAFLACTCMQAGAIGVYYSFLSGAPYVAMESRGLSASSYGLLFIMVAVGYLSGNLTAGRFSQRFGVRKMILWGYFPFILGVVLFWILILVEHPGSLFIPMMIVAYSNGMSLPSMITVAMSIKPEFAATASGLAGSAQLACGVVFSILLGILLPFNDLWLFLLITLSAVISAFGLRKTLILWR